MNRPKPPRVELERWQWQKAVASEIGPADAGMRLVLLTLSLAMDATGDGAWPSQRTLAKRSGLSERSVRKHLTAAHKSGWVAIFAKRPAGRKWALHEYHATVPPKVFDTRPWETKSSGQGAEESAAPSEKRGNRAEADARGAATIARGAENNSGEVGKFSPPTSSSDSSKYLFKNNTSFETRKEEVESKKEQLREFVAKPERRQQYPRPDLLARAVPEAWRFKGYEGFIEEVWREVGRMPT